MTLSNNKEILNKMRSYSSIFSSTLFFKLLQYDDYSFIDLKILKYDLPKIGKTIYTYYDYIQYVYKELKKQYKIEYIYKNTFINNLLIDKYGVKNTIAINEFRVGNSIADIVLFNGSSKAFEIKTELDSDKRLNTQLADYKKIFNECYIITHESLSNKYLQEDENIGIIELINRPKSLIMNEVRTAKKNTDIDSDTMIHSIRTTEYRNIVKSYYGKLPVMNSFNMFDICKEKLRNIPHDKLNQLFIEELKKRKTNTGIIKTFNAEIRQLCLAMNISANMYKELDNKLIKKINL